MARVAIVTGGTRGIGRAICEALKADGMTVVANYAGNEEKARAFSDETGIPAYKWDVGDHEATQAGCKQVEQEIGPIDVLVNNAGITRDGTMHKMTFEQWNAVIQTNLTSCFNMCRCVIDGMRERSFGRIVNIGSINGQAGQYGQVNYAAAKSGIHGFTKALAQEGARSQITVNAIAPGPFESKMMAATLEAFGDQIAASAPLKRIGRPDDMAGTAIFLSSRAGSYLTGAVIPVDGGIATTK